MIREVTALIPTLAERVTPKRNRSASSPTHLLPDMWTDLGLRTQERSGRWGTVHRSPTNGVESESEKRIIHPDWYLVSILLIDAPVDFCKSGRNRATLGSGS